MNISTLCRKIAKVLNCNNDQDQEEIIAFGLEIIFSELSKIIVLFSIVLIINRLLEVVIITVIFSIYRMISGGVHLESYSSCLIITILSIILLAILVEPLSARLWIEVIAVFFAISYLFNILLVIRVIPVGNKNHEITSLRKVYFFKKASFIFISLVTFICLFILINLNMYLAKVIVISALIGLNLQAFTLLPFTYKLVSIFNKYKYN